MEKPHILFILIDSARPDHLGCYGYSKNTSPFTDEFAESSTLYENAIAPGATFSEAIVDIEQTMGEGALDPYLMMQTIKHRITPEEMSGAMLFLCSNASDYMSGHLLVYDAGVALY